MRSQLILTGLAVMVALAALVSLGPGGRAGAEDEEEDQVPLLFGCGGLFGSDDNYEQNDTRATASAVGPGFDQSGLMSCDDDWYAFALNAKAPVHVDAFFTDASGDIDIALFDSGGTLLATSASTTDNESLSHTATEAGTYYVRVITFDPPLLYKGNEYRLRIQSQPGATATPTAVPPTPEKPVGDVNDDGLVDAIDAALILQLVAGLTGSLPNAASADANLNGSIDTIDAALVLQVAAGLLPSLPP